MRKRKKAKNAPRFIVVRSNTTYIHSLESPTPSIALTTSVSPFAPTTRRRSPYKLFLPTFRQRQRTLFLRQRTALPSNLSAKTENLLPPAENRSSFQPFGKGRESLLFQPFGKGREPMSFFTTPRCRRHLVVRRKSDVSRWSGGTPTSVSGPEEVQRRAVVRRYSGRWLRRSEEARAISDLSLTSLPLAWVPFQEKGVLYL
ncbi:hypothetical protein M5K25_004283 [Dendrobium thyrsiflorum]|uniref:Uncharacterized protein n=1 Tax=Dendrobium thyrsiflorum TaxID=117978 RepID=A0ABD0VL80_DENTH